MLYPSINDLLNKTENRYILVNEVAKRARQIVEGAECYAECSEKKPVSIATLEVYHGEIGYRSCDSVEKDETTALIGMAHVDALHELDEEQEEML